MSAPSAKDGSLPPERLEGASRELGEVRAENTRLWALLAAIREFASEIRLDHLMERTMTLAAPLVEADRVSLFMYDRERDELWSRIAQGLDSLEIRMPAGQGLAGSCARSGESLNVADAYEDERFNREVDGRTGYRTRSVLCVPVKDPHGSVMAVMQALNRKDGGAFTDDDERLLGTLAANLSAALENALLYERVEKLFEGFVRASSSAIDERDPTTAGHSRRVAKYAINLARAAHDAGLTAFTRPRLRQLRYAALLHDFGKIGVRESVLNKSTKLAPDRLALVEERLRRMAAATGDAGRFDAVMEFVRRVNASGFLADEDAGKVADLEREGLITPAEAMNLSVRRGNLTEEEWRDMKGHVVHGRHFLAEIPWTDELGLVPEIAHCHHEKLDGTGYPRGLCAESIDVDARILEVADIYDALTARDRPYKPAIPHEKARSIVEDMVAKGELDRELVRLFFEHDLHKVDLTPETQVITRAG